MQNDEISYYINKAKSLPPLETEKKIRVGLLSSFTINGLEEIMRVKCHNFNISCQTYVSGYNQYVQEILDKSSKLYSFSPDLTFLILDTRTFLGDLFHFPYSVSNDERRIFVNNKTRELLDLIDYFNSNSKSKLIIFNFQIPTYSPYGISENKQDFGLLEMIKKTNDEIEIYAKSKENIFCYDFNNFVTFFGAKNIFNFREFFFGDIRISLKYLQYLADDLIGYVKPILGLTKKCIVLDLDNTLWGGIIGEDGYEGIKLGNNPLGRSFVEFQKILLSLNQRGIILAINSKNNYNDAIKVIKEHPDMILKEENFASMMINWNDKVSNLKEIANELNIGLDSMIFVDDEPVNRELVKLVLPEVLTIDLPTDPSTYASTIMSLNDLNLLKITDDDVKRGKMYFQEKKRSELKTSINLDDFLSQLNIKLRIKNADKFTIPRISQLTLKTNQFNLTTKRYQIEDIEKLSNNNNYFLGCVQVEDKFGDNGITGIYIVKKSDKEWFLDSFLLSCRVMGRGIEERIIAYILQQAKNHNVLIVKGKYIPTQKNKPAENFFQNCGFVKDNDYWIFDLNKEIKIPKYIELIEE